METFAIRNTTRVRPRVPFEKIKLAILGAKYDLSLVLIGDTLGTRLNKEHKGKNTPTNVLSFPISETEGEIFINVRRAERDAQKFDHTPTQHIAFLFIHGCLHLTGMTHGKKMEDAEDRFCKKFV